MVSSSTDRFHEEKNGGGGLPHAIGYRVGREVGDQNNLIYNKSYECVYNKSCFLDERGFGMTTPSPPRTLVHVSDAVVADPFEAWISGLDGEDARNMLRGAAARSNTVYSWLDGIRVTESDDVTDVLALVNRELKPTRRFYDYEDAMDYAVDCAPTVQLLEAAADHASPELLPVIERAITLVTRAILKADDSSGMIGDQVQELLDAHARAVCSSTPPLNAREEKRVVKWIVKYRYGGEQDFFDPDIVAYAPGLSAEGIDLYRSLITETDLGLHGSYPLTRLAVLSRDRDTIVEASGGEPSNAMLAKRLVDDLIEAGLRDDALHYARVGVDLDVRGWSSDLIDLLVDDAMTRSTDSPEAQLEAVRLRREWFERFPIENTFRALRKTALEVDRWEAEREAAEAPFAANQPNEFTRYLLEVRPGESWEFALKHVPLVVTGSHGSGLWRTLCNQRRVDHPEDTLPVYRALINEVLVTTKKQHYYEAADFLAEMREAATSAGGSAPAEFDRFLSDTVERNKRRPNCIAIFRRKGLIPG